MLCELDLLNLESTFKVPLVVGLKSIGSSGSAR